MQLRGRGGEAHVVAAALTPDGGRAFKVNGRWALDGRTARGAGSLCLPPCIVASFEPEQMGCGTLPGCRRKVLQRSTRAVYPARGQPAGTGMGARCVASCAPLGPAWRAAPASSARWVLPCGCSPCGRCARRCPVLDSRHVEQTLIPPVGCVGSQAALPHKPWLLLPAGAGDRAGRQRRAS